MFSLMSSKLRMVSSAVAATAVLAVQVVTLDQGLLAAAPEGVVELGELIPVGVEGPMLAKLPEITVVGQRIVDAPTLAAETEPVQLPELVVTATREALVANATPEANAGGDEAG